MLLRNLIEVCITGDDIERFLNLCSFHGIVLYDIFHTGESCQFKIEAKEFFFLKTIVKKTKVKLRILQKQGILFWLKKQKHRKSFWAFPVLCLFLLWGLSHFLWSIQIQGNFFVTEDILLDFLQEEGIYYGMPLKEIAISDLKSKLRSRFDEVTWVSIYLKGTSLQISLKENDGSKIEENLLSEGMDLLSPVNGVVESVLLRQGTLQAAVGDEVKKGDILIQGTLQIPAEDGTTQEEVFVRAQGDIGLVCQYPISITLPKKYTTKVYTGREKKQLRIYTGHKSFSFWPLKVPFSSYDTLTKDVDLFLVSLFSLPLEIKQITYRDYNLYEKIYSSKEAQNILKTKFYKIIETLEEKGVQIIEKNVKMDENDVQIGITGNLKIKIICNETKAVEEYP